MNRATVTLLQLGHLQTALVELVCSYLLGCHAATFGQGQVRPLLCFNHCLMAVLSSAGSEADRDAIASVAGQCIKAYLFHDSVEVRTAALWVIINLTEG